jgi:hypothetical protein
MMSCSKLSEPRRVSSQMERTNDIWVGAMLSLARLVVAPPFLLGGYNLHEKSMVSPIFASGFVLA